MKKFILIIFMLFLANNAYAVEVTISDLTADANPTADDLIETENNPGGTPGARKVTLGNAIKAMDVANANDAADVLFEAELDTESELETQMTDMANIIQATEIDTFSEIDALVADKTLLNAEDTQSITGGVTFTGTMATQGAVNIESTLASSGGATITSDWDFGAGGIEIENNTAVPGSCTVGQIFMDTDATTGQQLYGCEGGSFVLQGDGGGGSVEGTAVLSTGEVGGTKFLREDGDGTSSWQTPSGTGDITAVGDCTSGDCFAQGGSGTDLFGTTGTLTLGAVGGTNNESLEFDFESDANTVTIDSTTGVTLIAFAQPISAPSVTVDPSANPTIQFKDSDATDGDINSDIFANATDTGSGSEDVDVTFRQQIGGSMTEWLNSDADGTIDFARGVSVTGDVSGTTIGGITEGNLVDKSATEAVTGDWDFGGGGIEIENATSVPGSCTVGQIFLDTDATSGSQLYACEGGSFVLQGGSGGSGDITSIGDCSTGDCFNVGGSGTDIFGTTGTLTLGSVGGSNNESLDWDFESTANTVTVGTTTGVSTIAFNTTASVSSVGFTALASEDKCATEPSLYVSGTLFVTTGYVVGVCNGSGVCQKVQDPTQGCFE